MLDTYQTKLRKTAAIAIIFLLCGVISSSAQTNQRYDPSLQYQNRGNRYEGVKQPLLAGYDIELISALADYVEPNVGMPSELKVRFYLKQSFKPDIVIREINVRESYWLDKVTPHPQFGPGFNNLFQWPSSDVIRKLDGIRDLYDLGVVVRLDSEKPSPNERVAPVIFYGNKAPSNITGYLFTFRTGEAARLSCSVFRDGNDKRPISSPQYFPDVLGKESFTFRWNSANASDGWYKLVVKGYFQDNNSHFGMVVRFYHRRNVE